MNQNRANSMLVKGPELYTESFYLLGVLRRAHLGGSTENLFHLILRKDFNNLSLDEKGS